MFNNISDWIKLPQQVQMPTVNMPKIPDIFGLNNNKKEDGEATTSEATGETSTVDTQQPTGKDMHSEAGKPSSAADSTPAASEQQASGEGGEHEKKNQSHMKIPIDIDASKAIGQAKEIGTNIGSTKFALVYLITTNKSGPFIKLLLRWL